MQDFTVRLERHGKTISEVEVELDACLCLCDYGDGPEVLVLGVYLGREQLPFDGAGYWPAIARAAKEQAEADGDLAREMAEAEGWRYVGLGGNDPDAYWRRPRIAAPAPPALPAA